MLTKNIRFKEFRKKNLNFKIKKDLVFLLNENNSVIKSLNKNYKNKFNIKKLSKYKNYLNYNIIGMGGSTLGSQAIYYFLQHKIKKQFKFIENLKSKIKKKFKKKYLNIIVSKSGNTLETIVNANIIIKKKVRIFLLQKIKKLS